MRKVLSVIAITTFAVAATAALAQGRQYDPAWPDRTPEWRGEQECWNPRAGHFERVRPGEYQNDLDFGRCRSHGYAQRYVERYPVDRSQYYDSQYYDRRDWRETREECWNPRARHFEEVRRGERQDDLDFGRCRIVR